MRRAVKEQIETTLVFEIMAACVALSIAVIVKVSGLFSSVFWTSFLNTWLWSFIVLSIIIVLLNIWRFVRRMKDLKRLAQKFGTSQDDMAEAIYKYGFREVLGNSFQNTRQNFRTWLEEQRRGTTTVVEIG